MNKTQERIYGTAKARLQNKFTGSQADLLAKCIVAQSQHETGDYTSQAFLKNNNISGYKPYPGSPYQTTGPATSTAKYAYFNSIENSSLEMADWLGRRQVDFAKVEGVGEYVLALKKHAYYEDTISNYLANTAHYFKGLSIDVSQSVENLASGKASGSDLKNIAIMGALLVGIGFLIKKFI